MADDVKDKLVNLEDLKAVTDDINDMTTGINLLRGTRDFTIGAESAGVRETDLKVDGWQVAALTSVSFSKDEEGFGVINLPVFTSSNIFSASVIPNEAISGKQITVSFDIKFQKQPTANRNIFQVMGNTKVSDGGSSLHTSYVSLTDNVEGYTYSNFPVDKWVKVVKTFNIPEYTSDYYVRTSIYIYGSFVPFSIRKVKLEVGKVNNPVWSPSPFDSITDGTSGINLLRGTRDFAIGKTLAPNASVYYLDGYYKLAYHIRGVDKEGFSTITIPNDTSSDHYIYSSTIPVSPGDTFTIFFDAKFSNPELYNTNTQICVIRTTKFGTDGIIESKNMIFTAEGLHIFELEPDTWYKFRYGYTIPEFEGNAYLLVLPIVPKNIESDMTVRKMGVYRGQVVDPIWSPSPFDLAQVDEVLTLDDAIVNLGLTDELHTIKSGDDLNDYDIPGTYACTSTSIAASLTNTPITNDWFKLYVEHPSGGNKDYVKQWVISAKEPSNEWVRYRSSKNSSSWTDWRQTYANTTVRPIEGGGTGNSNGPLGLLNLMYDTKLTLNSKEDIDSFYPSGGKGLVSGWLNSTNGTLSDLGIPFYGQIFSLYNGGQYKQLILAHNSNQTAIRWKAAGSWSDWQTALPISQGGTGGTTANEAMYNLFKDISVSDTETLDSSLFAFRRSELSKNSSTIFAKNGSNVWNWIRKKIESNLVTTDDIDKMFEGTYEPAADAKLVDDEVVAYAIDRIKEL